MRAGGESGRVWQSAANLEILRLPVAAFHLLTALRREQQRPRCPTLPAAEKVGHKRVQRSARCKRTAQHLPGTANGSAPLPGDFFGYFLVRTQESNTTPEGVFRYKANLFPTLQCESAGLSTNLQVPVAARAYLSCPGKKGSKEAGWGGFELCAPAHKSLKRGKTATGSLNISRFAALCNTPHDPSRRALSMVHHSFSIHIGFRYKSSCSYLKEIETERLSVSLGYTFLTD